MTEDLLTQQRRAAHRVQQMQDHARQVFEAHQEQPPAPPCPTQKKSSPTPALHLGEDQWLLLLLALLLFRSGCRTELLLALVYLAL